MILPPGPTQAIKVERGQTGHLATRAIGDNVMSSRHRHRPNSAALPKLTTSPQGLTQAIKVECGRQGANRIASEGIIG